MKRTNKVISIILSVFMLMQMMTGVVFASGKTKLGTPTNVKIAYDEGYEDYVYTFDAKVPSNIPSGYKVDYISTLSNDFLQIGYKNGDNEILYRMAKGSDDISGDYNEYKNIENKKVGDYSFIIRGNESGKAANLLWTDGKYTYSLYANPEVGTDALMSIADTIVNAK